MAAPSNAGGAGVRCPPTELAAREGERAERETARADRAEAENARLREELARRGG